MTLSRLQSGTGSLEVALVRAASAGDLSLGCAYQLADGHESAVQSLGDATTGPRGAALPLLRWAGAGMRETVTIDLRQVGRLRRAMFYGFSPSVSGVAWDGVLTATTYGGARAEVAFDRPRFSGTMVLMTIYNVRGELVLRAEREEFYGPPEHAAEGFGFQLPWLDGIVPA